VQVRWNQIRLVADFSRCMMKTQISPQKLTAECCKTYLRCRARRLRPKRDDRAALNRLPRLLLRQRIIVEPSLPAASPVNEVQTEFGRYLCRERGLVSTTVNCYGSFAGEFLADRFGTGPVDLSLLRPTDVTGFVRCRATSIKSKRIHGAWQLYGHRMGTSRTPLIPLPWMWAPARSISTKSAPLWLRG
jgi:hypothetical protein